MKSDRNSAAAAFILSFRVGGHSTGFPGPGGRMGRMDQRLIDKVLDCPRLPSLPAIAVRVVEMCRDHTVSVRDIGQLLSHDPALSARILRTINSSYYGLRQPVTTVPHAVAMLGLESVKMLALGFSLAPILQDSGGNRFDPTALWRRSLGSAVGAAAIARRIGLDNPDEAFIAGLLQDLGVIALVTTLHGKYATLLNEAGGRHSRLLDLERRTFDVDHTVVGEQLARRWTLPPTLVAAIRWHETPNDAPIEDRDMVRAVALAGQAADCLGQREPWAVDRFARSAREWLELDEAGCRDLLKTIHHGAKQLAKEFEVDTSTPLPSDSILAEASEMLVSLSMELRENAEKLEQENRVLREQSTQDELTGLHNRRSFDAAMAEAFAAAAGTGGSLSLIMLDLDRFKQVNDTHGHPVGDRVLAEVSARVNDALPKKGVAARYGGEEFAIVLPGVTGKTAANIAEAIRLSICETPVDCGDGLMLSISASLGLAAFERGRGFSDAAAILRAADQALYAAKASGRNCLRVAGSSAVAA